MGVETWIDRIGTSSFTVAARILVADRPAVRAKTVVVAIDPSSGTPTPLPDDARGPLSDFLGTAG